MLGWFSKKNIEEKIIREYKKSDFKKLKKLIIDFNREVGEPPEIDYFYTKNNLISTYNCFVLIENNEIQGFVVGQPIGKEDYVILDIYVKEEKRKEGFALELIKTLLNTVKSFDRILSNPVNSKSKSLFEKIGFKELPDKQKNAPKKGGKPPYYTHCLKNN